MLLAVELVVVAGVLEVYSLLVMADCGSNEP